MCVLNVYYFLSHVDCFCIYKRELYAGDTACSSLSVCGWRRCGRWADIVSKVLVIRWRGSRPAGSGAVAAIYKYTRTKELLWRKRDGSATVSRGERPTLALKGFYCFSRPLTSNRVLIGLFWVVIFYKGEDVAEYIKGGYLQCKGINGGNQVMLHTWKVYPRFWEDKDTP